jgi:hypothetical protein
MSSPAGMPNGIGGGSTSTTPASIPASSSSQVTSTTGTTSTVSQSHASASLTNSAFSFKVSALLNIYFMFIGIILLI